MTFIADDLAKALAPSLQFDTAVVIPVYYNEASVAGVVRDVRAAWQADGRSLDALQFVLVDDGSQDGSWRVLRQLHEETPSQVTVLRLVRNHGSQLAMLAGMSATNAHHVAVVAADAQEPASLVAQMRRAVDEQRGTRLVLAVRRSRGDDLGTRSAAAGFYRLIRFLGLTNMPEQGFDCFLMDRGLAQTLLEQRDPNMPLSVTIAWLGYPFVEVQYDRLERSHGTSRWTTRKKIKLAIDAITAISYAPIRTISYAGIIMAILGFAYAIFVVIGRLTGLINVEGWTTLIVVLLLVGGTQLLAMGIIGEYLWRTLEIARRRPMWRIAEIELAAPRAGDDEKR